MRTKLVVVRVLLVTALTAAVFQKNIFQLKFLSEKVKYSYVIIWQKKDRLSIQKKLARTIHFSINYSEGF
ncbi:hypothetical protein BAGA_04695 [Bacillus gaemokensis]|uniref:Uncharacterized protein n=1 Tax=Bacillus gaemokensis TaxID=574375 RepID=A0A073K9R3_9BACI|nr:hypothetical protein BAGA_04695 [Bacillus gaemokensis]KYG27219.1 hypothetical protein AZF08_15845 [Bacillus gaemokensis]